MALTNSPGIFLIVEFDWPQPFEPNHGQDAQELHSIIQGKSWIRNVMAASGGLGGEQSSLWIFWLVNYAALDRLFKDPEEEVARAYHRFFSAMLNVQDQIREEVVFQ